MAVTFDNKGTATTGSGTSISIPITTGTLENGAIIMGFYSTSSRTLTVLLDADAGQPFTQAGTTFQLIQVWYRAVGSLAPGAHTVNVSWTTNTAGTGGAASYSGVDQTTVFNGKVNADPATNPMPITVVSTTGDMTQVVARSTSGSLSSDQTLTWSQVQGGTTVRCDRAIGAATVDYSWTNSSAGARGIGVNIIQAAETVTDAQKLPAYNMLTGSGGVVGREYM